MRDLQVQKWSNFVLIIFFSSGNGGEKGGVHSHMNKNKINIIGDNFGCKSSAVAYLYVLLFSAFSLKTFLSQ